VGFTEERAIGYHLNQGEELSQSPHRDGFGCPLFPSKKHSPNLGIDGIEEQSLLHVFLPDNGAKRID